MEIHDIDREAREKVRGERCKRGRDGEGVEWQIGEGEKEERGE